MSTTHPATAAPPDNRTLPSPAERPEAEVVIFDGNCRICTAQVRQLAKWDKRGRLAFLSLHDDEVKRRYPDLSHDELMRNMYLVDRNGHRHRGAAAIGHLTKRLPRLWLLAPIMHIPGTLPIWQWIYRRVADRRYRFGRVESCNDGACDLHRH